MKNIGVIFALFTFLVINKVEAQSFLLKQLCQDPALYCKAIWYKNKKQKEWYKWEDFWPDKRERLIIKKINRLNMYLVPGIKVAIPKNMVGKTFMDFSPMPKNISTSEKVFIWNPKILAWGAYDERGNLLRWGPALGGRRVCREEKRSCKSPSGIFEVLEKGTYFTRSTIYPKDCKGRKCSWMPYYIKITYDGIGIHGAKYFIGMHDSHGCVRLFISDARWLSKYFFTNIKSDTGKGTKVIFLPY